MRSLGWIAPILAVLALACSDQRLDSIAASPASLPAKDLATEGDRQACVQAAHSFLGPNAEVLTCGHISNSDHIEAVLAIRVPNLKDDKRGTPISRLLIVRQNRSEWETELKVDANGEITNGAGYVGADYIDDSHPFPCYRALVSTLWGARDNSQFTLVLFPMSRQGWIDPEELGIGIGWNPVVGRFQEIEPNGEIFVPEIKSPKHIRTAE